MARPTSYNEEVIALAYDYLENYNTKYKDAIPMIVGLCKAIGRARDTVYDWVKHEDKAEFSDIVKCISECQEQRLINGTLLKEFEPRTANMLLARHGYSTAVDHTTNGGSINAVSNQEVLDAIKAKHAS